MPLQIVRNDIALMEVDAIVNTTNPEPSIGTGIDLGIHQKAGPELLQARKRLGTIHVGSANVTKGYGLPARLVIHTVCPLWIDGQHNEEQLLSQCYTACLQIAKNYGLHSIAFPLLASGNLHFPKQKALHIAMTAIGSFLLDSDLTVYLVVFSKDTLDLTGKLFSSIESYIDEQYVEERSQEQQPYDDPVLCRNLAPISFAPTKRMAMPMSMEPDISGAIAEDDLADALSALDAGFSETLLMLIDRSGKTDVEVYKKANISRKLFSKIRSNPDYRPSKTTVLAFCIALELSLQDTQLLLERAGYALSHSSKRDIIVEYFITHENYDIYALNEMLFAFDQTLIGD